MAAWAATRIESLNTSERCHKVAQDVFRHEECNSWAALGSRPTSRGRVGPKAVAATLRRRLPSQHLGSIQARPFHALPSGVPAFTERPECPGLQSQQRKEERRRADSPHEARRLRVS